MQLNRHPALYGGRQQPSKQATFVMSCVQRMGHMAAVARGAGASLSAVKALLDRTLDLARLEAGHGSVQPSRFQVAALWSDVVRAVAPAYRESGVRLHFKVGDVAVTADSRVAFPDMCGGLRVRLRRGCLATGCVCTRAWLRYWRMALRTRLRGGMCVCRWISCHWGEAATLLHWALHRRSHKQSARQQRQLHHPLRHTPL